MSIACDRALEVQRQYNINYDHFKSSLRTLMMKCIYTLGNPKVRDCRAIFGFADWPWNSKGKKIYIRLCPSKRDYTCLVYIPSYTPTSHCTCNAHQVSAKSHRKNVAIQVPGNPLCISSVWIACDPALEVQRQYNNNYI